MEIDGIREMIKKANDSGFIDLGKKEKHTSINEIELNDKEAKNLLRALKDLYPEG